MFIPAAQKHPSQRHNCSLAYTKGVAKLVSGQYVHFELELLVTDKQMVECIETEQRVRGNFAPEHRLFSAAAYSMQWNTPEHQSKTLTS